MCPSCEASNGVNGNGHANGVNGTQDSQEFTAIPTQHNPHPHRVSPYQPVQDFLSNVGRFKIIGMLLTFTSYSSETDLCGRVDSP